MVVAVLVVVNMVVRVTIRYTFWEILNLKSNISVYAIMSTNNNKFSSSNKREDVGAWKRYMTIILVVGRCHNHFE